MAWLFGDSFDFSNNMPDFSLPGGGWVSTAGGVQSTTRFGVGFSAAIAGGQAWVSNPFTNSSATVYINWSFVSASSYTPGGTTVVAGVQGQDGGVNQFFIGLRNGGDFVITAGTTGGAAIATSPVLCPNFSNVWYNVQAKIVINNTTGSVNLRLNGHTSDDWAATTLNTRNGTTNTRINSVNLTSNLSMNFDDFYVFDDSGGQPNTFQGDVRAVQMMPTSDTAQKDWTPNSGTNHFDRIKELNVDRDTTYLSDPGTVGHLDLCALTALSPTPNAIVCVVGKMMARYDDSGPHSVALRTNSTGTTTDSATLSLGSTYVWATPLVMPQDPHTATAWSAAGLAAVQLGPRALS